MSESTARTTLIEELLEAKSHDEILLAEAKITAAERHQ